MKNGSVRIEVFSTFGGLVRDHNSEWIFNFYKYLGSCNVLEIKLWGILDGLNLSLDQGFRCILIQTDRHEVVNAVEKALTGGLKSALIRRIRKLLPKVLHWSIQHISREENKITDNLIKTVRDKKTRLCFL
ncbi:hypothetical protein J1N35_019824 [Gossypium stocksii]|uniref:RNase H type-1 domain-containing protein n=1 Tax=Gossypium stocksii TaxID=47602 RepID=A0A9D3ZZS5_9ROSI|nr:hypothetical protein J1N35_019824 [Gossypium stocksii]